VSWAKFLYPVGVHHLAGTRLVLPVGIITTADQRRRATTWGQDHDRRAALAAPPLIIYAFLTDYYIAGPYRRRDARVEFMAA
jgi:multiple sugar transport system permease protein